MGCNFISVRLVTILVFVPILIACTTIDLDAQTSDPRILPAPDFILSDEAVAAGIDGTMRAAVSIDKAGKVTNVRLYGDPIWPCGTSPKRELEAVRTAVEAHLRSLKFEPAVKNGKPSDSDVMLDFALGDAFKRAVTAEEAKKGISSKIVKVGTVNGRAISLMKPFNNVAAKGIVNVQVLVDEQGSVSKAGVLAGNPLHFKSSRDAACGSKFSPTLIDGKAVQVTGVIIYIYR